MAHLLSTSKITGKVEMFYTGDIPWHGLGTALPQNATADEALDAAGLRWTVGTEPIHRPDGIVIPDWKSTVRQDTGDILGVVKKGYHPIQNEQIARLTEAILEEGGAIFNTAGAIKGGRVVWFQAELPSTIEVVDGDVLKKYLTLMGGHDGTRAVVGRVGSGRVVCNNTLDAFFGLPHKKLGYRAPGNLYVKHTVNAKVHLDEARRILGLAEKFYEAQGKYFRAMSAKQLSKLEFDGYINAILPVPVGADVAEESTERAKTIQERLAFLFEEGRGNSLPGVKGTLWAAFNAVTEYVDHVRPLTEKGLLRKGGFEAAVFGSGQAIRQKAFDVAADLVTVN